LNSENSIDIKSKLDNKKILRIENSYVELIHASLTKCNKLFVATPAYAKVFDLSKLMTDSIYDIRFLSSLNKFKVDTTTGLLVYSEMGSTGTAQLYKSTVFPQGNFETPWQSRRSIRDFIADQKAGILIKVNHVYEDDPNV